MDPNRIDVSGLPTFALILVIATAIVYALYKLHKSCPQVSETIKDSTPWMGWTETDPNTDSTEYTTVYRNNW